RKSASRSPGCRNGRKTLRGSNLAESRNLFYSLVLLRPNTEAFHLVDEGGPFHSAETSRCFGFVPTVGAQGHEDLLAFTQDLLAALTLATNGADIAALELQKEGVRTNSGTIGRERDCACDLMTQLPHISGPTVGAEQTLNPLIHFEPLLC